MAFVTHYKLSARGVFRTQGTGAADVEEFSYSLSLSRPPSGVALGSFVADMAADVVKFHQSAGAKISGNCRLREVKLASIGPDGRYTEDSATVLMDVNGGGPVLKYPPQVALAVSLGTGQRGPSKRGRFYIPGPGQALQDSTFGLSDVEALGVVDATRALINDLNNQPGIDRINSPAVTVASTKGFNTDVTEVSCGRVFDTIRSRRRSLPEAALYVAL